MPYKTINGVGRAIPPTFTLKLVKRSRIPEVKIDWPGHGSMIYTALELLSLLHRYRTLEFDEEYIYRSALMLLEGRAPKYWEKGSITKSGSIPSRTPRRAPVPRRKKSFIARILERLGIR